MSDYKHFEQIWEEAEELALKTSKKEVKPIVDKLQSLFKEYSDIDAAKLDFSAKSFIKQKKFGEILFALTELSKVDDVNVYLCLLTEMQFVQSANNQNQ